MKLKVFLEYLETKDAKQYFLKQLEQKALYESQITKKHIEDIFVESLIKEIQLSEAMKDILPKSLEEKVGKKSWREKIKEKHGDKAFLDPKNLEFPVYDERGPHCGLIYAAYIRAKQWHHNKIAEKAKNLFIRNRCKHKLDIEIHH